MLSKKSNESVVALHGEMFKWTSPDFLFSGLGKWNYSHKSANILLGLLIINFINCDTFIFFNYWMQLKIEVTGIGTIQAGGPTGGGQLCLNFFCT